MFGRTNNTQQQVKDQVTSMAQSIIEQAASRAILGMDKTRGGFGNIKGRVPKEQLKRAEEIAPTMREVALQAASAALDLWQAAKDRAEEAVEAAEHKYGEGAADAVGRAGRAARDVAAHVVDEASGRAKVATHFVTDHVDGASDAVKHAASNAAGRADEMGGRAKEATKHAAGATVTTSRDTGAALFWTAAAAGIVFYALLDKARREQVLSVLDSLVAQARDVIRDVQGYDEEYA